MQDLFSSRVYYTNFSEGELFGESLLEFYEKGGLPEFLVDELRRGEQIGKLDSINMGPVLPEVPDEVNKYFSAREIHKYSTVFVNFRHFPSDRANAGRLLADLLMRLEATNRLDYKDVEERVLRNGDSKFEEFEDMAIIIGHDGASSPLVSVLFFTADKSRTCVITQVNYFSESEVYLEVINKD